MNEIRRHLLSLRKDALENVRLANDGAALVSYQEAIVEGIDKVLQQLKPLYARRLAGKE